MVSSSTTKATPPLSLAHGLSRTVPTTDHQCLSTPVSSECLNYFINLETNHIYFLTTDIQNNERYYLQTKCWTVPSSGTSTVCFALPTNFLLHYAQICLQICSFWTEWKQLDSPLIILKNRLIQLSGLPQSFSLSTDLSTKFTAKEQLYREMAHPEAFPRANCPFLL